ncbi:MAG: universal stress protein [Anaeromyxobacter sp.]
MKEIHWKKVCCPVDFSAESHAALRVATDLCKRFGGELTLVHVNDASHEAPADELAKLVAEVQKAGLAGAAVKETDGDPKTAIAEYANHHHFDLVVMGTHGRTGRAHALVGSVAENTVRRSRCPVMVIHADWPGLHR